MKYAYYPGCSYETTAREYDISTRIVCKNLGIELTEVPDWNCCGSTAAHSTSHLLGLSLAARNLALVEETKMDVTASCASCYQRLAMAHWELSRDETLREKVNKVIDKPYLATIRVLSILEVIANVGLEQIAAQVVRPLIGLKTACYYGCLLVRPASVKIDDSENPMTMDNIMVTVGAEAVDWSYKNECCGAGLAVTNEDIVLDLTHKILKVASSVGANCLVTACPLCHFNLDIRQGKINKKLGTSYNLPVFYFTQLLGLAMGINPKDLGLDTHFVNTEKVLKLVG